MKCYAVIDTNVLVSALLAKHENSATVKVVNHLFDGTVIPVFSELILAEYGDVLRRKKFGFTLELVDTFLTELRNCGKQLQVTETGVILPDEKDVPFYEVVLESGTDDTYLVTGNIKHFPPEMFIVTPARFIEIVETLAEI